MFFKENSIQIVKLSSFKENNVITHLFSTNLVDHVIIFSSVVAKIQDVTNKEENSFIKKGEIICSISYLGGEYDIKMEQDGFITKKYVVSDLVIDYHYPLFLLNFL